MEDLPVQRHQTSFQYRFKNQVFQTALGQTKGDREKAETLANVWFNVHFLGCKYSGSLMQQIESLTPEEFKEYAARRKL